MKTRALVAVQPFAIDLSAVQCVSAESQNLNLLFAFHFDTNLNLPDREPAQYLSKHIYIWGILRQFMVSEIVLIEGSTLKNLTINFDNKRIIKNSCGPWSYNSYFQNFSLKNIQWKSEPSKCSTPSNWNIFEADFALFDYKIDISTNEKRINGHVTWWNSIRCNLSWQ